MGKGQKLTFCQTVKNTPHKKSLSGLLCSFFPLFSSITFQTELNWSEVNNKVNAVFWLPTCVCMRGNFEILEPRNLYYLTNFSPECYAIISDRLNAGKLLKSASLSDNLPNFNFCLLPSVGFLVFQIIMDKACSGNWLDVNYLAFQKLL